MMNNSKKKVFVGMSPHQKEHSALRASARSGGLNAPLVTGQAGDGKKVVVGMSGGVDSSVTAYLLKKQGYDVHGVFMKCYNLDGCVARDSGDAKKVAEQIGIPFDIWDFEEAYKERVVKYMVEGYKRGETPNPDVMCNREIKFGLFLERALKEGADYVSTGHYVKVACDKKHETRTDDHVACRLSLLAARDTNKDQSYFLWTLTQKDLAHCLFPIGDYLKPEVRAIAREAGFATADKKDSQGICFLGSVSLEEFLSFYLPAKRGDVLNIAGEKVGEHSGSHFYTIGQRHIGLGDRRPASVKTTAGRQVTRDKEHKDQKPLYVTEKDVTTNTLVVAEGSDHPTLFRKELELRDVNFINPDFYSLLTTRPTRLSGDSGGRARYSLPVFARVRYRQLVAPARLEIDPHPSTGSEFRLVFDNAQKFVAPGQSAVFYSVEGEMLGGGIIV